MRVALLLALLCALLAALCVARSEATSSSRALALIDEDDEEDVPSSFDFDTINIPSEMFYMVSEVSKETVPLSPEDLLYGNALTEVYQEVPVGSTAMDIDFVVVDKVINYAKELWNFIEQNRAVSNYQSLYANALPKGAGSAFDLSRWNEPYLRSYQAVYKNLYGINVIDLTYTVSFVPGGQYKGKGRYLDRVTILPTSVKVAWGFKLEAQVQVPSVTNTGTTKDPVAAAQVELSYKITGLNSITKTESFYARGDGYFKWLNKI